jgi:hypothetical protein
VKTVSENLITSVPFSVNEFRNVNEAYKPLSVYRLLRNENMVLNFCHSEVNIDVRKRS